MALIIDIKINSKIIYHINAVRHFSDSPKGVNAYKCTLISFEKNKKDEFMLAHKYEDGAMELSKRLINHAIQSPKKNN